jgi:hypothetical protein
MTLASSDAILLEFCSETSSTCSSFEVNFCSIAPMATANAVKLAADIAAAVAASSPPPPPPLPLPILSQLLSSLETADKVAVGV